MIVNKKYFILFLLLGLSLNMSAQLSRRLKNNPRYDRKVIDFGFSIGLNYTDLRTRTLPDLSTQLPGYYRVYSEVSPGYNIRIISKLRLGDHWDLNFSPGYAFTVRTLRFDILNQFTLERELVERDIESSFLEFPFYFKFRADRIGNYRMYLLAGPKYNIDLASDQDVEDDRVFKLKRNEVYYDMGIGVDIYFEFFKFSPQIIYSFGITNQKVEDDTFLAAGLQGVYTRGLLINFTFE
tara:strand:- start:738 stop:1451 length:714 start_codon:yes stop_codon:yes gene_type:complete